MASSTPLKDLEENFFLCPVCLEIFQDPKLLPCLHRYCGKCLRTLINASVDGTIECPMCKQECAIPNNGIDGFKSDFHMKSVVEFIQLQKTFEKIELKECVSCSEKKNVSAYCFKCKDFLCEQCYHVHITSNIFTDHKPRTLNPYTECRNITLENVATLAEDPRCQTHVEENAKLCCSTCENEPICVICTYTKHKGHDLHGVAEVAKTERELLKSQIAELQQLKSKMYEFLKNVEAARQKLNENVSKKTDKLINQHKDQVNKIKRKLEERRNEKVQGLTDIDMRRKDEVKQTTLNYEEELNKLNKKYDEINSAIQRQYNSECELFKDCCEKIESELASKLESLDFNLKSLTDTKHRLTEKHQKEIAEVSNECNQVIGRYDNVAAIALPILSANDGWAHVQCIPGIRAACKALIEEMKKEYPQLDSLSDIYVKDMPNLAVDVTLSGLEQTVIDVVGLNSVGGWISGIASDRNGTIVISGKVSDENSHITVINTDRKIKRQDQLRREKKHLKPPFRYCCYLRDFNFATVCVPDEIGIYDVRDGSYNETFISDVTRSWSADLRVWCMDIDPVKNHIIVGTNSRNVFVFDDQLKYIHTIKLPNVITGVNDISVHADMLLVCNLEGARAYAVTMEGSESKLIYEFPKPEVDGRNWGPYRVCTDKNDFICMLWRRVASQRSSCTIVIYSQCGRRILTTTKVDSDAISLATVDLGLSEKLLLATMTSGKMYEYGIKVT